MELWTVVSQEPGSSPDGKRTCKTFLFRVEMLAQEVHLFTTESKEQGLAPAVSKTSEPLMDETVATLREDQYSNPAIRIISSQYDYIVNDIMSCYRSIVRQYIYVRDVT